MDFEINDATVTRAYSETRGAYTTYCLNVTWQDGSYPNALKLTARTEDVFAGIKEGDKLKRVRGFVNGRAWAGNAEKGEMVFVNFKVTRPESIDREVSAAAPSAMNTAKSADVIKLWSVKHGVSLDEATSDWNTATSELTKTWKTIFPTKRRNQLTEADLATVCNAIIGVQAEAVVPAADDSDIPF